MTSIRSILVLAISLSCIHCSEGEATPNYPGSVENERSLLFDGVDGHGTAGRITETLGDPVERFSISMWFKSVGQPSAQTTMVHLNPAYETGRNSMQVRVYWSTPTQVAFLVTPDLEGDAGATLTAEVADPQEWNHLALTFDATAASDNVEMYLNGNFVGSDDQPRPLIPVGNINFARLGDTTTFFHGYLDEVAFWESRISMEEVQAIYNDGTPVNVRFDIPGYESADSVRSLWRMGDENFLGEHNVSDLVGENHFTILGGGTFVTEIP